MGIHDDDIAKVRSTADLVALIGEHTEIKRSGRQWMARCPMHGERTPSLSVSPEKGVYYCFGCQRSGDAITFVQEMDNLDFAGAVESLAGRYGVQLRYTSANEGSRRARKRTLLDAVDKAVDYYHDRLLTGVDAGEARGYLRSRGYDGDAVRKYKIGWAPDDWDKLAKHLRLDADDLKDAGLGFVNKAGRQQDFFRGRVMFPIYDERGDPVGFGGRILPGHEGSKYKNTTTEAVVYDKSRVLYGLHTHREGIVKAGEAIICEGYTDVIGFADAGIPRAVATCGTAMTEEHVKLLKRFSADRLVLAFDADAAGLAAAERVYEWEREHGLEVRVADLPPGVDPADLAREDPAELQRAVDEATPFLSFRLERVLTGGDLSTVEGRARTAEAALDVIAEHPDPLVRDAYVLDVADRCRVDLAKLRELAAAPRVRSPERDAPQRKRDREAPPGEIREVANQPDDHHFDDAMAPSDELIEVETHATAAEDEALRLAIHRPNEAVRLNPALFADPVRKGALAALQEGGLLGAGERAGEEAAGLLRRLAVDPSDADPADVLAGLARSAGRRTLGDLRRVSRALDSTDEQKRHAVSSVGPIKLLIERLDESDTREEAIDQLLPWLIGYDEGRSA
ncbi:MAG: DNA primase [Acidimicrobiales bacterium]|jgi:DNA primase|nr:DNA primase [Acidimicrobiales bacterium]